MVAASEKDEAVAIACDEDYHYRLWHCRMGHTNDRALDMLMKKRTIPEMMKMHEYVCDACISGKQTSILPRKPPPA